MASRLRTVSSSDSPFATLEASFWKESTSAPSPLAATSNELRVRVLFSKKRVMTLRPRSRPRRSPGASPDRALARSRLKRPASESNASICTRVSASSSSRCRGKSISDAMQKPSREMRREPCLQDLPGRLLRVVLDAMELDHLGVVVPDAVARAGILVARLAAASDRDQVTARAIDPDAVGPDVLHGGAELEGALQVGMPDERQLSELVRAQHQILGLLEREDVLEGLRVARRSAPVRPLALGVLVRKRPEPLHVLRREGQRAPVDHFASCRIVVAVIHPAGDRRIVVSKHGEVAAGADQIAGGVRIGPVTDRIP